MPPGLELTVDGFVWHAKRIYLLRFALVGAVVSFVAGHVLALLAIFAVIEVQTMLKQGVSPWVLAFMGLPYVLAVLGGGLGHWFSESRAVTFRLRGRSLFLENGGKTRAVADLSEVIIAGNTITIGPHHTVLEARRSQLEWLRVQLERLEDASARGSSQEVPATLRRRPQLKG